MIMNQAGLWLRPKYANTDHLFKSTDNGRKSACKRWKLSSRDYRTTTDGRRCKLCELAEVA